MFKLSFITDEATQSIDTAIALAKAYQLDGLELRSIDNKSIDKLNDEILHEYHHKIKEAGLKVPCIAGSFLKIDLQNTDFLKDEYEKFLRLIKIAQIFEAPYIRGFTGLYNDNIGKLSAKNIAQYFDACTGALEETGIKLLLEADPHVNTPNHKSIASILEYLSEEHYAAIYDPGNSLYSPSEESPFPQAYEALADKIKHVHIKDVVVSENGEPHCVLVGSGQIPYTTLLQRLKNDGYSGYLSLEPHYRNTHELSDEQMLHPKGSKFSEGGLSVMEDNIKSIKEILQNLS
jgi:sugar phosphate isomerase/epimerase